MKNLNNAVTREELESLIRHVQGQIEPEFRAYEDDDEPGILLTIASDGNQWSYQTGDIQFYGGSYLFPCHGQAPIYTDTNPEEAAKRILEELEGSLAERKQEINA